MDTVYYHLPNNKIIKTKIVRGDRETLRGDLKKYYYPNKKNPFLVISLIYLFIFLIYRYGMCNL
jgi:hypothetical protein